MNFGYTSFSEGGTPGSPAGEPKGRSDSTSLKLSILIPILNECAGLAPLMQRLSAVLAELSCTAEIIFIDDGSTDGTREALAAMHAVDQRIRALHLSRNFGKEHAIAAGLLYVSGDAVVIIDGDLQHPPELIPALIAQWRAGYDIVYGVRRERNTDSPARRLFSQLFYVSFNRMSGTKLPQGAGDFRLLSRKAVMAMNLLEERQRFNKGLYSWIGFSSIGVPYHVDERKLGGSKWNMRRLASFAFDGITAFSIIPLRFASVVGFVTSLAAMAYAIVFIISTLLFGADQPGFPTLIVSIMFFSGLQLICLGLVGEYLGRVYEETKARPLVIVDDVLGLDTEPPALPRRGLPLLYRRDIESVAVDRRD